MITSVRQLPFQDSVSDQNIKVTISIGINCEIPPYRSHESEFLKRADRALYYAKDQGRDRWAMVDKNGFICEQ